MNGPSIFTESDFKPWKTFLEECIQPWAQMIYYTPEYVSLYKSEGHVLKAFGYAEGDDRFFLPGLVREINPRYCRIPSFDLETAYGYGGLLTNSFDPGFLQRAWSAFLDFCHSMHIVAGLLRFDLLFDHHRFFPKWLQVLEEREAVILTLDKPLDEIWRGYNKANRNKIRKAEQSRFDLISGQALEDFQEFATVYHQTMERLNAGSFYRFSPDYFQRLHATLGRNARVFLARLDHQAVAGALTLEMNGILSYHLSGTAEQTRHLGPSNLLHHKVVEYALEQGLRWMHFGGGRTPAKDDSLLKFKSGFSTERAIFKIGKLTVDSGEYEYICSQWARENPSLVPTSAHLHCRYRLDR